MKVIAKTDEYTIFQKRNERYAVQGAGRAWINGDAKVAILLEHKLIEAPAPKAPEPEPAAPEAAEADDATEAAAAEAEQTEATAEGEAEAEGDAEAEGEAEKEDK